MRKELLPLLSYFGLQPKQENKSTKRVFSIAPKSISKARKDISHWNKALQMAMMEEEAKTYPLYNLLDDIMQDALLKSQMENRINKSLSQYFTIYNKEGEIQEEITNLLQNQIFVNEINKSILGSKMLKHSVGEFQYLNGTLSWNLIPRQNVDPYSGIVYQDYTEDKKIKYRELKEYGTWILEFGQTQLSSDFGLVNCVVPHVLFKKFAQSCWSELCEIYGIPPRVMKTNTQDKAMLDRAEAMMRDIGSAAFFIIDESEKFEWAQGVSTNGDVYRNLIQLCNNEISMVISGAVIGQDTVNGSRAKDESSQNMLDDLIASDLSLIEQEWNSKVLKALQLIGYLPMGDYVFKYDQNENLELLWTKTKEALPYYKVDMEWVKSKFGIEITAERSPESAKLNLNGVISEDFFD